MKSILAIETSSPELSIALSAGKGPILEKKVSGIMNHAEKILPVLQQLLKSKKTSIEKIDAFLIGRGPGSFTGLRVGFATLKGFLALKKKKCYGALSLDLIAEPISLPEGSMLNVVLDAHREKVYARSYKCSRGKWIPKSKPQTFILEDWIQTLPKNVYLVGDATIRYRSQMEAIPGRTLHFLPEKYACPRAATLLHIYKEDPKRLQKLEAAKDFIPLYFRLSEAEERKKASQPAGTMNASHC